MNCHVLAHRLRNLELTPMLGMRNPGAEESLNGAVYLPNAPTPSLTCLLYTSTSSCLLGCTAGTGAAGGTGTA